MLGWMVCEMVGSPRLHLILSRANLEEEIARVLAQEETTIGDVEYRGEHHGTASDFLMVSNESIKLSTLPPKIHNFTKIRRSNNSTGLSWHLRTS
jgi:hypothetical protein